MSEPNAGSDLASLTTRAVAGRRPGSSSTARRCGPRRAARGLVLLLRPNRPERAEAQRHQRSRSSHADPASTRPIVERPIRRMRTSTRSSSLMSPCLARTLGQLNDRWSAGPWPQLAHERAMLWIDNANDLGEVGRPSRVCFGSQSDKLRRRSATHRADVVSTQYALQSSAISGSPSSRRATLRPSIRSSGCSEANRCNGPCSSVPKRSVPMASTSTRADRPCGGRAPSSRNTYGRSPRRFRAARARSNGTSSPRRARGCRVKIAALVKQVPKFEEMQLGPTAASSVTAWSSS